MKRNRLRPLIASLVACAVASPFAAFAASGEFTFVVGDVSVTKTNGQRVVPVKGTPVDPGDRIATGANGMAQLTMVDNARLSLRPSTQFVIENYAQQKDSQEGAVLNLLRGTLRTFTGLIASANRDRFVMKTRVATVGIRGSGNILYACEGADCDPELNAEDAKGGIAVNHTIEGSHAVSNVVDAQPGLPPQQGGAQTLVTGPGQTVLVTANVAPRYIPTPTFIANAAVSMTNAKPSAAGQATATQDTRNFAPSDTLALPASQTANTPVVGNNGLGFASDIQAAAISGGVLNDPEQLRDIIITSGSPFEGQARNSDINVSGGDMRGYSSYAGTQSGTVPAIVGGTSADTHSVSLAEGVITMGRFAGASLGFFGAGSATAVQGSVHWIMGPSGYPPYLSDVLTGTATYTLAASTSPTNQFNTTGSLSSARLDADFTTRTLGVHLGVSMPAAGGNPGGTWQMNASGVPFSRNSFFTSTNDALVITSGGTSSATNPNLGGSIQGSFVGAGLDAAILGYGIADRTASSSANWNLVSGVAALTGSPVIPSTAYVEGRISDPNGTLPDFVRSYAAIDRPEEVTLDAQGRVVAFTAPFSREGGRSTYTIGSAQVVESGSDPQTGLIWGRWSGGQAQASGGGTSHALDIQRASLHYIFAGVQNGPVALPLTGTATYDVIGSTTPTNGAGQTGTLNSAALNANFSNRTVDAMVNVTIASQTWNASASGMPIYRNTSFSAYTGTPIVGLPNPAPLVMTCTPSCGQSAAGSIDGFFTGHTGEGAGMMYNLGGNQGAIAFRRRGGG